MVSRRGGAGQDNYLNIEHIVRSVSIDKVVRNPLERSPGGVQLIYGIHLIPVFKNRPRQHCGSKSHRETKLHMITGIEHSFRKIYVGFAPIIKSRIASPGYSVISQFTSYTDKAPQPTKITSKIGKASRRSAKFSSKAGLFFNGSNQHYRTET